MIQFLEAGDHAKPTILLIDSGMLKKRRKEATLQQLQQYYHVIMPVVDENKRSEQSASEIEHYMKQKCNNAVYAVCSTFGCWPVMKHVLLHSGIMPMKTVVEEKITVPGSLIISELQS